MSSDHANTSCATSSLLDHNKSNNKKPEESDEDLFRVPDIIITNCNSNSNNTRPNPPPRPSQYPEKRRRGRNPADKEYKRLKRLLRNRVSAQQARERKKVYVSDLESRAKQLQDINSKLQENISTLVNENTMLRQVLINTRPKVGQSNDQKSHLLRKH